MKLEIEIYSALCETETFVINGTKADARGFGEADNHNSGAEESAHYCRDMQFTRILATPEVLAKYGITKAEYALVAGMLENSLSFGPCGWCE